MNGGEDSMNGKYLQAYFYSSGKEALALKS